jgi:hypothetical protein
MKRVLVLTLLVSACAIYLFGCSGILLHHAIDKGDNLSPAQIREYSESGAQVYGCFTIGGPPPIGNTVWIIIPKGASINANFVDGCHLLPFATRP